MAHGLEAAICANPPYEADLAYAFHEGGRGKAHGERAYMWRLQHEPGGRPRDEVWAVTLSSGHRQTGSNKAAALTSSPQKKPVPEDRRVCYLDQNAAGNRSRYALAMKGDESVHTELRSRRRVTTNAFKDAAGLSNARIHALRLGNLNHALETQGKYQHLKFSEGTATASTLHGGHGHGDHNADHYVHNMHMGSAHTKRGVSGTDANELSAWQAAHDGEVRQRPSSAPAPAQVGRDRYHYAHQQKQRFSQDAPGLYAEGAWHAGPARVPEEVPHLRNPILGRNVETVADLGTGQGRAIGPRAQASAARGHGNTRNPVTMEGMPPPGKYHARITRTHDARLRPTDTAERIWGGYIDEQNGIYDDWTRAPVSINNGVVMRGYGQREVADFHGSTNTGTNETIHCISGVLRPGRGHAAGGKAPMSFHLQQGASAW